MHIDRSGVNGGNLVPLVAIFKADPTSKTATDGKAVRYSKLYEYN